MPKKKVVKKAQKRHKRNRQRYAQLHGYGPRPKQIRADPFDALAALTGLTLGGYAPSQEKTQNQGGSTKMRRALLKVSPALLGEFLRNREVHVKITSGIPDDAKFISAWYEPIETCFYLCYESAEFSQVKEGDRMPVLDPPWATTINQGGST